MQQFKSSKKLGVVAISYNEEVDLPGFINHLYSWVDEIVIIDDGSTDKTEKIARAYSEKVKFVLSPRTEKEYYADQRNKGIEIAESEWLLHMDIDERVTPELASEIKREISGNSNFEAYKFRRQNYFLNRPMSGGGWAGWNAVHLAKKNHLRFGGMYHEAVELTTEKVGQLANKMVHLNDNNYSERISKSNKYIYEVAEKVRNSNKRITGFQIFFFTLLEFLKVYFFKRGFKDGAIGLIWALHASSALFKSYTLVWDNQNRIEREVVESKIQYQWKQHPISKNE